jgi:hypothetical protein
MGLMLGGACATKYLAVGFAAAPVLLAMLGLSLRSPRRLGHVPQAALAALLMFCPWLLRSAVYTGNPVFPLATGVFGRGHWTAEAERRWIDGHGPAKRPPVPKPEGWQLPEHPGRVQRFYRGFLGSDWFGPGLMLLGLIGCALVLGDRRLRTRWNVSLVAILGMQTALWGAATHEMPSRFVTPALVPLALLAGAVLGRLARLRLEPPATAGRRTPMRGGLLAAWIIFLAAAGMNLITAWGLYRQSTRGGFLAPLSRSEIARGARPWRTAHDPRFQQARFLLVGDARAFYFPKGTVYATVFDSQVLVDLLDPSKAPTELLEALRRRGITHVWVDWTEIGRLSRTYGYPKALSVEGTSGRRALRGPALAALERLGPHGLRIETRTYLREPREMDGPAPYATIYSLPWAAKPPAVSPTSR